jgi:hypothetical protein
MKISFREPAYFSVEKKSLISQSMLKRYILPSDYIHKFLYFLHHCRVKIRRHIAHHQPFSVKSTVHTLAVCHEAFYFVAIFSLAGHRPEALLVVVAIFFSQSASHFRKTSVTASISIDF